MDASNKEPNTNLIRSVLTSEVKFVIGIALFVFGIAKPYYEARQDIALIQQSINNINTNHEAHIQDILKSIEEIKKEQISQQNIIIGIIGNKTH